MLRPAYSCDEWVEAFIAQWPSLHYCHMEQMVPFTMASLVHKLTQTRARTHFHFGDVVTLCHANTCEGQAGLMNSTVHAACSAEAFIYRSVEQPNKNESMNFKCLTNTWEANLMKNRINKEPWCMFQKKNDFGSRETKSASTATHPCLCVCTCYSRRQQANHSSFRWIF